MSRHLERLLQIDHLIRGWQRQTSVSLARVLEVTDKTIRNDIHFMRDRFYAPLEYSKKEGWHYTDLNWRLPSISLSKGELFALTLGARMLSSYAGSAYEQELRSSIKRLSERLPENTWVDLQQLAAEKIIFRSGAEIIDVNPQIWLDLLEACRNHQQIWIRYYTASRNQESERIIDPYFLDIYRGTNRYVIGFCHNRKDFRYFKIDRIRELKIQPETFVRDPNFDAKTYMEQMFQSEIGDKLFNVKIWFDASTAPYIREKRWHPSQEITEHEDGSLILHLSISGLNDLKRWILGYGKGAKTLEPSELVNLMRTEVKTMNEYY